MPVKDAETTRRVVVHVSPHPDDEAIAAGMTLQALAARGWSVVNLLLSAGRPGDEPRRIAEATEAARRGGYRLELAVDALGDGESACVRAIADCLERERPALLVSPQPHDGHPAHETVGRAVRAALEAQAGAPVWWSWGLWAALERPTLYVPHGATDLHRVLGVLAAYPGETARNDYRRLAEGLASANTVLGSEWVFGFGSAAASAEPYAELFTELVFRAGEWHAGPPRVVDLDEPLRGLRNGDPVDDD